MSIGNHIRNFREQKKMTQQNVADELGVSYQAVSSWEREEYLPELDKIKALAKLFDMDVSKLLEEKQTVTWDYSDRFFDEKHMYTFLNGIAAGKNLPQFKKALSFAKDKHAGQVRDGAEKIPYIIHPLTLACHALAMGIDDDAVLAAIMLHDTVEDCGVKPDELPADEEVKELVRLLTKNPIHDDKKAYYKAISKNPKAALIKCMDRLNNLSTMASGFTREKMAEYVRVTEQYVIPMLDVVKACPEYNNAAWLLKYQIRALLETYKRLL